MHRQTDPASDFRPILCINHWLNTKLDANVDDADTHANATCKQSLMVTLTSRRQFNSAFRAEGVHSLEITQEKHIIWLKFAWHSEVFGVEKINWLTFIITAN